jgi:hypothetical protein
MPATSAGMTSWMDHSYPDDQIWVSNSREDMNPHSRCAKRPSCSQQSPSMTEGAGNAGCLGQHLRPRVRMKEARKHSHHRYSLITGIPCATVLTVSSALFPETRRCCLRRLRVRNPQA